MHDFFNMHDVWPQKILYREEWKQGSITTKRRLSRGRLFISGPRKQDRSCPGCTTRPSPRYEQVRTSPGACLNQTAAARNKGLPPLAFDIRV
ncbi:hypothetical protein SFRURICE_016065 [Spodoptera frugiperda]|nr:hypothetical protein SFRURICE_016065 [Spodoptera frugiperda]